MNKATNRILVLDDDPDIGIMIKIMLEYKGYSVILTDRADKAADIIREDDINLLIMDMLLSGVNGTDVCTELKQNSLTSSIPIMMISAHPNAKRICMDAGADDFISKPFDMQDLVGKIDQLIPAAK
ncbi:MAG TPA: response regulator [Chitinophagaceae bacterium]|nr:response regulator [Chitinophagaceae bacterium]